MIKEQMEQRGIDKMLLFSLMLVVFFPLLPPIFGKTSMHVIPIATLVSLLILFAKRKLFFLEKDIINVHVFFGATFLLLLFSLVNDAMNFSETSFASFSGILKPIYFYVFFLVGYSSVIDEHKIVRTLCLFFEIAIIFSFLLAVIEVFFIDQFKSILYFLYKRQERIVLLDKATGWFGVTYYFAYFNVLLCFYSFFRFIERINLKYSLFFLCSFITLFLTQSRTVILALLAGFLMMPLLKISFKNKKIYLIYFLLFSGIIILMLNYYDFFEEKLGYAFIGIKRLFIEGVNIQGSGTGSANIRINQIWWAWENNSFKILGQGLARRVPLESVYAAYTYRLGVLYLLVFIYLLIYFYRISSKLAIFFRKNETLYAFFSGLSLFYLTSPISLFASASHEMPKLAFLFFICSAVVYRFHTKYKKKHE